MFRVLNTPPKWLISKSWSHIALPGNYGRTIENAHHKLCWQTRARNGKNSVVTTDYYSDFIEMEQPSETTSQTTIKTLKKQFSRHGISNVLISDGGPQHSSDELRQFGHHWELKYITSPSKHPQSNIKAKSADKTYKSLLRKVAKTKIYLA